MNEAALEQPVFVHLVLDAGPAFDVNGQAMQVGDEVTVQPERVAGAQSWRGKVAGTTCMQPEGGEKLVSVQPIGKYQTREVCQLRARLCRVTKSSGAN